METDSNLRSLIKELYNSNNEDPKVLQNCSVIADGVINQLFTVTDVITDLEEFLTHTLPEKRATGVLVLTSVLEKADSEILNSRQLSFICDFYKSKLSDHHQIIPATLRGILALSKANKLPNGTARDILQALFTNIPCQQQQQCDRNVIYRIFICLLQQHEAELQTMGLDFVYGVMSAMDSERDPRNLLLLFNWLPNFLSCVRLEHLAEEMFEVIACYFPIDFRAPSQDPNAIERDTLAEALKYCLCALPEFGEYCVPLALEKLDSSLRTAKLDSLDVLSEGCKTFTVDEYTKNSTQILYLLQKQLFNNETEIESECLETLTTVVNKLSQSDESNFKQIVQDIIDTTKGNLLPDAKLFETSSKILLYIAKSSKTSTYAITKEIIPLLVNTFHITNTSQHKAKVLKVLRCFLPIVQQHELPDSEDVNLIPTLCLQSLLHGDEIMRLTAVESLSFIAGSLSKVTRVCLYDVLSTLLVTKQSSGKMRAVLLELFKVLCANYKDEVLECVIKRMKVDDLSVYLETLSAVGSRKELFDIVLPVITSYCVGNVRDADVGYHYLRKTLEESSENDIFTYLIDELSLVDQIISWSIQNVNSIDVRTHQNLLNNEAYVLMALVGDLNSEKQKEIVPQKAENVFSLYDEKRSNVLLVLLYGLLLRLRQDVEMSTEWLLRILEITLSTQSECVHNFMVKLSANVLNKTTSDKTIYTLNKLQCMCNSVLSNCSERNGITQNAISTIAWISKALLMKNDSNANSWLDKLLQVIDCNEQAAMSLKVVMADDDTALNLKCYCNVKILYKQRAFAYIISKLNTQYRKENYNTVIAFGYLLQETPEQILRLYFKDALRLLIVCLDVCVMPDILYAVLKKLRVLLENSKELMEQHVELFIPRFLKLSKFRPSMKVRIEALRCIQRFSTTCPLYVILPLKNEILIQLAECLDDPKRLVRKEAVEARSMWFLLGASM